jgi:hypothetical protein
MFFDGMDNTGQGGPFPFAFTLGCFEVDLPASSENARIWGFSSPAYRSPIPSIRYVKQLLA